MMLKRIVLVFYFVLLLSGFVWPGILIGNRVEPFVFGLPFLFFWFVFLIVVQGVSWTLIYRAEFKED